MTGMSVRFTLPYRMPVYRRPLRLSWALFFDNHMRTFCLRYSYRSRSFWNASHGAEWIDVKHITNAINRTTWLDRRQKGRAIRKARRIQRMLVAA